jgi:hypothetical protein
MSLLEYLDRNGSKSTCYFLNRDSAITWCTNLEEKSGTSEGNPLVCLDSRHDATQSRRSMDDTYCF